MAFDHQDWETIVFKKPKAPSKSAVNLEPSHLRQLKDNPETYANKYFDKTYIQKVVQSRVERKWSQKYLALQLNVDPSVVQRLEQGKEVYNASLKSKINRVLNITAK